MITVAYHRKYHRIVVSGHACSGESGHDLVCASVSALVYTAAANMAELAAQGSAKNQILRLNEGDAEISCDPVHRMRSVATLILDSICTGFSLLETYYPENVRYTVFE